jgi:hypothetical protein
MVFMGSSGSGRFGTYDLGSNKKEGSGTSSHGENYGTGEIECPKIISNFQLEDVATSDYYKNHKSLPNIGEAVYLRKIVHNGRLVVEKTDTHEILGNLPTQYNFLLNFLINGKNYSGFVVASGDNPIPFIVVTLNA